MTKEWRGISLGISAPAPKAPAGQDAVSQFELTRTLDPAPRSHRLAATYAAFQDVFPMFRNVAVEQEWAGMIDATPDAIPVISTVKSLPGIVIATGFSGHGFGIGPGAGRLAADLVTGATPIVDPQAFRYERFIDGTRPRPTTGV